METYKIYLTFVPQEFIITANNSWEAVSEAKKRLVHFEANGGYIPVKKSSVKIVK